MGSDRFPLEIDSVIQLPLCVLLQLISVSSVYSVLSEATAEVVFYLV